MPARRVVGERPFRDGNNRAGFVLVPWCPNHMDDRVARAFEVAGAVTLCVRVTAADLRDIAAVTTELARVSGGADAGIAPGVPDLRPGVGAVRCAPVTSPATRA